MKKLVSLLLMLAMLCMALPVYAQAMDMTGDWYCTKNVAITLTLNADGTYVLDMTKIDQGLGNGTWAFDGASMTMDAGTEYETVMPYHAEDNTFGDILLFSREPVTIYTPAPAVTAESIEAFAGNWECISVVIFGMAVPPAEADMGMTLSITGDQVTMRLDYAGDTSAATMTAQMVDGTLVFMDEPETTYAEPTTYTIALLEDGYLCVTFEMWGEAAFYMAPVAE